MFNFCPILMVILGRFCWKLRMWLKVKDRPRNMELNTVSMEQFRTQNREFATW